MELTNQSDGKVEQGAISEKTRDEGKWRSQQFNVDNQWSHYPKPLRTQNRIYVLCAHYESKNIERKASEICVSEELAASRLDVVPTARHNQKNLTSVSRVGIQRRQGISII